MARYRPDANMLASLEKRHNLPEGFLDAIMQTESAGNPNAVSPRGARGLMQFMPATAKQYGVDVNDPESSIRGAAQMLGELNAKYQGDIPKVAAAYNWGQGNVDRKGMERAPTETRNYIQKITRALNPISEAQASEEPYKPTFKEWKAMKLSGQTVPSPEQAQPTSVDTPTFQEWKAKKLASQPGIMERAGQNLPQDLTNIGEGVIGMVKHPIDTLEMIGGLPMGAAANLLPESWTQNIDPQDKENAANLGRAIVGAIKHPLETFANKPASTVLNTVGLLSGAGSLVKGAVGKATKAAEAADIANANRLNKIGAKDIAIVKEAQKQGYVIPKSEVASGFINNRLEGFAGKAALNQESILRNQKAVTAQARKVLGVPDDTRITGQVINDAIKNNYKPYEDVAALPTQASVARGYSVNTLPQTNSSALLKELKQARHDSQAYYRTAEVQGGNPDIVAKADALSARAKEIEGIFEQRAVAAGKPELVPELRKARENIAKIYDVDDARNVASGEIDPVIIGRKLDKSPDRMSGELEQIGEFQQKFPKYAKTGESAQTPGVSKIEAASSVGGYAILGPFGALLPFLSTPVRNLLLSKWYQKGLAKAMIKHPSRVKKFMSTATNKNISEKALLGLIASDKSDNKLEGLIK
ncbi:MAG: lytic transglycosylase domain-containing protein [Patescibacteria group bacterium]